MADFTCKDINGLDVSQFVFNEDGTVSGVVPSGSTNLDPMLSTYQGEVSYPYTLQDGTMLSPISQNCCNALNFIWESSTNTCYWSETCAQGPDFKIVLGAQGNDGAWFQIDENETCHLEVEFNYLFQFDCSTLSDCLVEDVNDSNEIIDLQNQITDVQNTITQYTETIGILTTQLTEQTNACNAINTTFTNDIQLQQSESDDLVILIAQYQTLIDGSSVPEEIAAFTAQQQIYETLLVQSNTILAQLNSDYLLAQSNCDNEISAINNTITTYQNLINESNVQLDSLQTQLGDATPNLSGVANCLDIFSGLSVSVTLDKVDVRPDNEILSGQSSFVDNTTLTTVYSGQLYKITDIVDYFDGNCNTGLLVTGDSTCMQQLSQCIIYNLSGNCGVFSACTLNSDWLHHKFVISDEATLSAITNEKVKLGFVIENTVCDFSILIDRIEINKVCTSIDKENIYVSKCPNFELERICDNKKSWVATEENQERDFFLSMRETDYNINHHKLAINTKEVDLDISPANGIETDVWCYVKDNESMLDLSTATTVNGCGDSGLDLQKLLTTELSAITTVKEFNNAISTELIDAKNRKTISAYPTLKALYNRYKYGFQNNPNSSAFDYTKMGDFVSLVGNYWVDLIEQVIPSTTIWGSTYKYGNTVYDQDKFKYKKYTLTTCTTTPDGIQYPSPIYGGQSNVEAIITDLSVPEYVGPDCLAPSGETTICNGVMIQQINDGSEFIGAVRVVGGTITLPAPTGLTTSGVFVINECMINITSVSTTNVPAYALSSGTASVNVIGAQGPITYAWSNGQTTPTITGLTAGAYSVTVTDTNGCSDTANFNILLLK